MIHRAAIPAVVALVAITFTAAWSGPGVPAGVAPESSLPTDGAEASRAAARFVVAPAGNEARYRVNEQLAGFELRNDAVGVTGKVSGGIAVDVKGSIIPGESRFVVDVSALKSDKDRRDGYVQRRLLETEKFPTVELTPTAIRGLPVPLPAAQGKLGPRQLEMTGNLTVRGVTPPTTWRVTASYDGGTVTGTAATAFTFADFQMEKPRVASVLSVADTIRLEYDFTLVRQ
jgi:polyisoprenoid-binding protein YceI